MAYQVNITHFINPHLFWFCKINTSSYVKIRSEIALTEQQLAENNAMNNIHPLSRVGDLVSVYFLAWKRFIRARVDYIVQLKDNIEYTVWALDYGFPFQTKLEFLYSLPKKYDSPSTHIKRGGLANILPVEKEFYMGETVLRPTVKWNEKACHILETLLKESYSVVFEERFQIAEHYWGEIRVTSTLDKEFYLSSVLKKRNFAERALKSFRARCPVLKTIQIEPWFDNDGKYTCKHNELNSIVLKNDSPKFANLDVDLGKDHVRKVNDWKCSNESVDNCATIETLVTTHLGMAVITKNTTTKLALEKFIQDKKDNHSDNMDIYSANKDMLPIDALLSLNTSLPFDDTTKETRNKQKQTIVTYEETESQQLIAKTHNETAEYANDLDNSFDETKANAKQKLIESLKKQFKNRLRIHGSNNQEESRHKTHSESLSGTDQESVASGIKINITDKFMKNKTVRILKTNI